MDCLIGTYLQLCKTCEFLDLGLPGGNCCWTLWGHSRTLLIPGPPSNQVHTIRGLQFHQLLRFCYTLPVAPTEGPYGSGGSP
jgi:hypothetical protein